MVIGRKDKSQAWRRQAKICGWNRRSSLYGTALFGLLWMQSPFMALAQSDSSFQSQTPFQPSPRLGQTQPGNAVTPILLPGQSPPTQTQPGSMQPAPSGFQPTPTQVGPTPFQPAPPRLQPGLPGVQMVPVPAPTSDDPRIRDRPLPPDPNTASPDTALSPFGEDLYVLGPGDAIQIDIFDVPEFSGGNGRYTILVDGSINVPWLGSVFISGLTLSQAADRLAQVYSRFINEPLVTVALLDPRPLRISVLGEVTRPGAYVSTVGGNTAVAANLGVANRQSQWPTVIEAIQAAGGITQRANIRNIVVRRPRLDGTERVVEVNLWSYLQGNASNQDITLRDGDSIIIPQAQALTPEEATLIATANFSPQSITVNVVGEVPRPGPVQLPPNTSLNQAILGAGGFNGARSRRSTVELVRLNLDGTVTKRTIAINFEDSLNQETNPALRNNDVVIVSRNRLVRASDFLTVVFQPIQTAFNVLGLFRIIQDLGGR